MNEQKEFDDYIKGFFETDPAVPSELEWETMVFDLPEKPSNSFAKNGRKYLIALLVLLMIFPIVYFSIKKQNAGKLNTSSLVVAEQTLNEEISSEAKKQPTKSKNGGALAENIAQTEANFLQAENSTVDKFTSNDNESKTNQESERVPEIDKVHKEERPVIINPNQDVKKASTAIDPLSKPGIQKAFQSNKTVKGAKPANSKELIGVDMPTKSTVQKAKQSIKKIVVQTTDNSISNVSKRLVNATHQKNDFQQNSLNNINKPITNFRDSNILSHQTISLTSKPLENNVVEISTGLTIESLISIGGTESIKTIEL